MKYSKHAGGSCGRAQILLATKDVKQERTILNVLARGTSGVGGTKWHGGRREQILITFNIDVPGRSCRTITIANRSMEITRLFENLF